MDLEAHTRRQWLALPGDGPVVVAVSGGRDSMALLAVLARIASSGTLREDALCVAHFDHRLRGPDSDRDRELVTTAARALRRPLFVAEGSGLRADEASLRAERWRFLEDVARRTGARAVATAHHGGDQLETLLLRLLRGTGPRGLAGMRPLDGLRWRPWLDIAPERIERWARENGIVWREDTSNRSERYARNRLRHGVVPTLVDEAVRHGDAEAFFRRLAETCHATRRLVDDADRRALAGLRAVHTAFFYRYLSDRFDDADATLDALAVHLGRPLLREQRRRALSARHGPATRATWGQGLEWRRSCGFEYVTTPAMRATLQRWRQEASAALADAQSVTPPPLQWRVDRSAPGEWRFPRPGDRLGRHKLKRVWLEARVPEPERALQVVLAEGNRVRWTLLAPGPRLASAESFPFAVSGGRDSS
jgi:tRNA(Ile)-lysidine synthetase-like protein